MITMHYFAIQPHVNLTPKERRIERLLQEVKAGKPVDQQPVYGDQQPVCVDQQPVPNGTQGTLSWQVAITMDT